MLRSRDNAASPKPWMVHAAGALVALLVAVVFYQGIYAPLRRDLDDRTQRIAQIRELSTNGEQAAADHRQLSERLDALQKAVGRTRRRMPTEISADEFVAQAAGLAEDFGLEVRETQTAIPQHHPTHSTVEVSYMLSGSYASMCRFLAAIDQFSQLTKVSLLDVERSANSSAYPLQVKFQLYYQSVPNDKDEQRGAL
jgi:Tfp pilus assembly protein PilO